MIITPESTHHVRIDTERGLVYKTSTENNPNYGKFLRELAVYTTMEKTAIANGDAPKVHVDNDSHTITVAYYGSGRAPRMGDEVSIGVALQHLYSTLAQAHTSGELHLHAIDDGMDAIVDNRCHATVFAQIFDQNSRGVKRIMDAWRGNPYVSDRGGFPVRVAHGDLAPRNMIIGDDDVVHLIDFESVCVAPTRFDVSSLALNAARAGGEGKRFADHLVRQGFVDTECVRYKVATSVTHRYWRDGYDAAVKQLGGDVGWMSRHGYSFDTCGLDL